jgi:hypothetical protein
MPLAVQNPTTFPGLQQRWVDELVGPIPKEMSCTCQSCVKLPPPGRAMGPDHYDPRSKCCTYLPMLHNYLVGALLDDDDPGLAEGKATVEERIDAGLAVTPLGLYATQEYLDRYDSGARFGRDVELRCPHFLVHRGGACGVWRHRESTCSTWYCVHDRGEADKRFWRDGLAPLLRAAELKLADWCAREQGATDTEWGRWKEEPRALYRACSRLARTLSWSDVAGIGGDEVRQLAQKTLGLRDWL